jgi:hypothetical protein
VPSITMRAAEPAYRSDGRGAGNISTSSTFGSDRTGRRRADRRRPVARVDAVAPADGSRSHNREARNRAAQGQPGTNGPRQCERRRAAQGEPGTNGLRHCQGFRAEPAAQDISSPPRPIAAPTRKPVPTLPPQHSAGARPSAVAARRTVVAIRARGRSKSPVHKLKTASLYREKVSRRAPHCWPRQNVHPLRAYRHI